MLLLFLQLMQYSITLRNWRYINLQIHTYQINIVQL